MPKFVKQPVEVEAIDVRPWDADRIAKWCGGEVIRNENMAFVGIDIKTMEGTMRASNLDWIIKGVNGEFYPCKPEMFQKSYRLAESEDDPA